MRLAGPARARTGDGQPELDGYVFERRVIFRTATVRSRRGSRKQRQALHPALTLTEMYNVLAKLRAGETLAPAERTIHEQGLVTVLRELHDAIDRAVLDAYGWQDLSTTDNSEAVLLERLVALNAERAAEERQGLIRWLRPAFQAPLLAQHKQGIRYR